MITSCLKGHQDVEDQGKGGGGKEYMRYFSNYKTSAQETNRKIFMIIKLL